VLKIAAAASVEISEATQAVYVEQLARLNPKVFTAAVERTIREWDKANMMPPIAFILARAQENQQVLAEAAWETLQRVIYRDWHPDIGWIHGKPPGLDPAMEYAIRQCGGLRRIHDCPMDAFSFLRRDFIAAHLRYEAEGGEQVRLSETQAKQILGALQKELNP
jgi:hypothetical protein